ncbi:iron-sulfur cluster assembly scaffold protein [Borrelia miyamotoi]|uniref:Iron-sulfur cluster assembly scaffold protein n=1 Tax=Borrelia miyamotoi TaxID=47466 RepID=A0AAX3JNC5_9SPIR|nr:iron-sulfur cluster assembly scaffold protein [Borrelia miyamotoi]QFP42211.1 iron-sulfur cluster assembly scaffold protein [Borrelia miyamotoi]QFP48325.1 iron-sulfur cluster assembly scaffold protein [Borrelia miyamotoi]QGT56086.1 iron-sulfur cluster assembly scaffold protein [Borrelia miyamotoi]QGT56866.1 iron-sulfur cluster assembly scaffold protein [Borrelia miyamotoi]WAZ72130.1 iron-sulfur cluster assembly scaffold protein [Borrelia miyamotoi]
MFSEKTKKELIRLSKLNQYYFKTDKNQNPTYHQSKCGDKIVFQIKEDNEKIRLKYNAHGCIILLSSAYILTELCDNKPRKAILEFTIKTINQKFEKLEEIDKKLKNFENFLHTNRKDCFMLPYKALSEILNNTK